MNVITERELIRSVAARWRHQYGDRGDYSSRRLRSGKTAAEVAAQLDQLDPETATAADVARIIGNDSWTRVAECDECRGRAPCVVEVGEPPDYESSTARLCLPCAERAVAMLREAMGVA